MFANTKAFSGGVPRCRPSAGGLAGVRKKGG